MTEISTTKTISADRSETTSEDVDFPEDLDSNDESFYKTIVPKLSLLQLAPKEETVVRIIHYSRNYK